MAENTPANELDVQAMLVELRAFSIRLGERLRELTPAALDLARVIAVGAERAADWYERAPAALTEAVRGAGLIVPVTEMTLTDLVELTNSYQSGGSAAAVACLLKHYDYIFDDPTLIPRLRDTWSNHRLLARRYPVLSQALLAHDQHLYAVSVPTLIAQFEGVIADAGQHQGRMSGSNLVSHVNMLAGSEEVSRSLFQTFVTETLLATFGHGQVIPPFSRHAILHGADLDYGTEMNSRTAILLVDSVRALTE